MTAIAVKVMLLHPDAQIPHYATVGSAGADLVSVERVEVFVGCWKAVHTGIAIELPPFYEAQIRPRSGLALKHGISVLNAPSTIDSDYRGEVLVLLINHGPHTFVVEPGMRIAQMVIAKVAAVAMTRVEMLTDSVRGESGFGSTGR